MFGENGLCGRKKRTEKSGRAGERMVLSKRGNGFIKSERGFYKKRERSTTAGSEASASSFSAALGTEKKKKGGIGGW